MSDLKTPAVSIIVPVYNAMPYLKDAVYALLNQSCRDFELLLVDDGSSDSSPSACDAYEKQDPRVRVFHNVNSGPSAARNFGLDHARGTYVMFCDADDICTKNALSEMVSAMETYGTDLVIGGYTRFVKNPKVPTMRRSLSPFSVSILKSLPELAGVYTAPHTNMFGISIWAKLYRRDIIEKNGIRFPLDVDYEEDCCFNLLYFRHMQTTAALKETVYQYRQQQQSLSKGYRPGTYEALASGYRKRREFMKELSLEKSLPSLAVVFMVATNMTLKKVDQSGLSRKERIAVYRGMIDMPECREAALRAVRSPVKLTKITGRAILSGSPALLDLVVRTGTCLQGLRTRISEKLTALKKKIKGGQS